MADRRRVNGPLGGTIPPVFLAEDGGALKVGANTRSRPASSIRKIFLKTGVTPSASGSAYLEIETSAKAGASGLKLSCTVHGPKPLPRSAPFSPYMVLSAHVKYAPFATRQRRGYLRDATERDLGVHLETALRGAIIADRRPKSGVDIVVSIIEGDQDRESVKAAGDETWDHMNVLSGCITVASAALADAGIDCVDTVAGGVAAIVTEKQGAELDPADIILDPVPTEHEAILAACCVGYLPNRAEVTNIWLKGDLVSSDAALHTKLISKAVQAAKSANLVLVECLKEALRQES